MSGRVRVGRRIYSYNSYRDPIYEGFTPILCLTASSSYGDLGPYVLKDSKGRIMENIYQGSKVYPSVPYSCQRYSRYNSTIIWKHPAEKHVIVYPDGSSDLLPAYYRWRQKLMNSRYPIRYPVTFDKKIRASCLYSLAEDSEGKIIPEPLDYIEGRKKIYLPVYTRLVKQRRKFKDLQSRLFQGENLLIIEVDGPHQEDLKYYQDTYGVESNFIEGNTMLATKDNLQVMLEDTKHPFGHGYCLAGALLGIY